VTALLVAVVVAGYLVHLYRHPFKACGRCKGRKTNRGSSRRSWGKCKGCGGTGERQRLGSRQLHRAVRSLAAARTDRKERKP